MISFGKRRNHFKLLVIPAVCVVSFFSCSKDPLPQSPVNPSPASTLPYTFPLTTGSYWVYQDIRLDSNLNFISSGGTDSVFVTGDSIIGTDTFKVIRIISDPNFTNFINPGIPPLLRDSAGYLVQPNGDFLEHDNFTDTLRYNLVSGFMNQYGFMRHPDSVITVPAGTFQTIDFRRDTYYLISPSQIVSQRFRQCHRFFANEIGIVSEYGFYQTQPDYHVSQLLRYHIQ